MTETIEYYKQTRTVLRELGIPAHRVGYKLLCEAIPRYALNDRLMLSKELYPALAKLLGLGSSCCVEHAVRYSITQAWSSRDGTVWAHYFPNCDHAPSNLRFIATLAERIKGG